MPTHLPLKTLLAFVGLAACVLGLNFGFGGMRTMGWQNPSDFVAVTRPEVFLVVDSHVRFIGGLLFGAGLLFLAGSVCLNTLRTSLVILSLTFTLAGFFRLTAGGLDILDNAAIAPSLAIELIGFPALAIWIWTRAKIPTGHLSPA